MNDFDANNDDFANQSIPLKIQHIPGTPTSKSKVHTVVPALRFQQIADFNIRYTQIIEPECQTSTQNRDRRFEPPPSYLSF
jgi:hypothetical protein